MAEYIEREALLEHIAGLSIVITELTWGKNQLAEFGIRYKNSILRGINDFPAADVAPVVHGRWAQYRAGADHQCTHCNWSTDFDIPLNYCPNCGAKMDGEILEK